MGIPFSDRNSSKSMYSIFRAILPERRSQEGRLRFQIAPHIVVFFLLPVFRFTTTSVAVSIQTIFRVVVCHRVLHVGLMLGPGVPLVIPEPADDGSGLRGGASTAH